MTAAERSRAYHPPKVVEQVRQHEEATERVRVFLAAYESAGGVSHVIASINGVELHCPDLWHMLNPVRLPQHGETWESPDCVYRCESSGPDDRGNYAWSDGHRLHLFTADGLTPQ